MDPNEIRAIGKKCADAGRSAALAMWDFNIAMDQAALYDAERHFDPEWRDRLTKRARRKLQAAKRKRDRFARTGAVA